MNHPADCTPAAGPPSRTIPIFLAAALLTTNAGAAIRHTETESGLDSWHLERDRISVELIQRLPDQSRAYFQGRGFTPAQAEPLARSCIFQAIIRNTAPAGQEAITLDLTGWEVRPQSGRPHPPKVQADWIPLWETRGVSQAARIAFQWSLFPTRQRFAPGDWNMGMVSMGLPFGAPFDLAVRWTRDGEPRSAVIPDMRCAPDRHL